MKKIIIAIVSTVLLIIGYYAFMIFASKEWMTNLCQEKYCLELLPLSDYLSISIAVIGLVFVIQSLDAWKEQNNFINARNICNKLMNFHYLLNVGFLMKIQEVKDEIDPQTSLEEQREIFLKVFSDFKLFEISDEIDENLYQSHCLFKDELNEIQSLLRKNLNNMNRHVKNEKYNFIILQTSLHKLIRNDGSNIREKLTEINKKLNQMAS